MATLRDIATALRQKCGFEVVNQEETATRLRLAGRVRDGQTNINSKNWLLVIQRLLRMSKNAKWSVDISKHYIEPADRLLFEWRLIFQAEGLATFYDAILAAVRSAPVAARGEVTEIALAGATADRNVGGGGRRGAGLTDKTAVGPLALNARLMGG